MQRYKKAILIGLLITGLIVVVSGVGIAWHNSLSLDEGPEPAETHVFAQYSLEFSEGSSGWEFDEVRIFIDGNAVLASSEAVDFFADGELVEVDRVDHGDPTASEQDDTDRDWGTVIRVELAEELDGTHSYRTDLDGVAMLDTPGEYRMTLNTYQDGTRQTNRDGPDESTGDQTVSFHLDQGSFNLIQNNITEVWSELDTIESELNESQTDFDELQTEINRLESQLDLLEQTMDRTDGDRTDDEQSTLILAFAGGALLLSIVSLSVAGWVYRSAENDESTDETVVYRRN